MTVGAWTRYSATFTANALATRGYRVSIYRNVTTTSTTTLYAGAQLELGSIPTKFAPAGKTRTDEQLACFRYYQLHTTIYGTSDGLYKFTTNPAGYLLRATPTSVVVGTISAPFSGSILGTNVNMTIGGLGVFYTNVGSLGSGGWVAFTNATFTSEL
jgi:hypothetical protein